MKNKTFGFFSAALTAILTFVTLVVVLVYGSNGGQVSTLVPVAAVACEVSLLFGEKIWTDFTGILAAPLLAFTMMTVLSDGIWNIAEAVNGIKMVGMPELAGMNYALAGLNLAAIITAIITCFTQKSK